MFGAKKQSEVMLVWMFENEFVSVWMPFVYVVVQIGEGLIA